MLTSSEEVVFLNAGETFVADRPRVVLDKGTYLELVEALDAALPE